MSTLITFFLGATATTSWYARGNVTPITPCNPCPAFVAHRTHQVRPSPFGFSTQLPTLQSPDIPILFSQYRRHNPSPSPLVNQAYSTVSSDCLILSESVPPFPTPSWLRQISQKHVITGEKWSILDSNINFFVAQLFNHKYHRHRVLLHLSHRNPHERLQLQCLISPLRTHALFLHLC